MKSASVLELIYIRTCTLAVTSGLSAVKKEENLEAGTAKRSKRTQRAILGSTRK